MNVFGTGLHKSPWKSGLYFRGGDICDPLNGQWFGPKWPTRVWRTHCKWPILPFFSVLIGRYGFYVGFKLYGADRPEYFMWMLDEDVYEGSVALCLSARMTNSGGK